MREQGGERCVRQYDPEDRVWDAGTGALEATLRVHGVCVASLVVHVVTWTGSRAHLVTARSGRGWWGVTGDVGGAADGGGVQGRRGAASSLPRVERGEAGQRISGRGTGVERATLECEHTLRQSG